MAVNLWIFDDGAGDTYTVPVNPNKMTTLYAAKAISTRTTTAIDGNTLFFQGRTPVTDWQFAGVLFDKTHYDALYRWVYQKGRITITDHFNRKIACVLTLLDAAPPEQGRSIRHYWLHQYTVKALVISVDESAAITDGP